MKRTLYILIAILAIQACGSAGNKPTVVDEEYNPTDEELFDACAELQGVAQFEIGKTTFRQVLKDKDYLACSFSSDRESTFYLGHWGSDFWKYKAGYSPDKHEKARWIEKQAKGRIKQIRPWISGLKVAGLEFDVFDMAFLNDTLVGIWFYPKREFADEIIEHYKEKYGNGRGYYHYYQLSNTKDGDISNMDVTEKTNEKHVWENEKVALEYKNDEYFHVAPGEQGTGRFDHSYIIYSKNRFPVFEDILNGLSEQYDNNQQQTKKDAIDAL